MQVWQQEKQGERQRPNQHSGKPCPAFEAAPSTFGKPTGKINRTDRNDRQRRGENLAVEGHAVAHLRPPILVAPP
jgi:hypothetical protein